MPISCPKIKATLPTQPICCQKLKGYLLINTTAQFIYRAMGSSKKIPSMAITQRCVYVEKLCVFFFFLEEAI
jgi:hypothetical protein